MQVSVACEGWGNGDHGDKEKRNTLIILLVIAVVSWVAVLFGSQMMGLDDSGLTPAEKQMSARIREIALQSRGDWKDVSEKDRRFLIYDVSFGDETSARMLLAVSAGKTKRNRPQTPPRRF